MGVWKVGVGVCEKGFGLKDGLRPFLVLRFANNILVFKRHQTAVVQLLDSVVVALAKSESEIEHGLTGSSNN